MERKIAFPRDSQLVKAGTQRCIHICSKLASCLALGGWRKYKSQLITLSQLCIGLDRAQYRIRKNREQKIEQTAIAYVSWVRRVMAKIVDFKSKLPQDLSDSKLATKLLAQLNHFLPLLQKSLDLLERRLVKGEKIPHDQKIFSIFQPLVEWIQKGKASRRVELGHKLVVATDQYHFIVSLEAVHKRSDASLAIQVTDQVLKNLEVEKLRSISFDKGFYSKENKEKLSPKAQMLILPKRGKKSKKQAQEKAQKDFAALRKKHSAIEANINQLEHHGLNTCPDRTWEAYKRYAQWGAMAYNLSRIGKRMSK